MVKVLRERAWRCHSDWVWSRNDLRFRNRNAFFYDHRRWDYRCCAFCRAGWCGQITGHYEADWSDPTVNGRRPSTGGGVPDSACCSLWAERRPCWNSEEVVAVEEVRRCWGSLSDRTGLGSSWSKGKRDGWPPVPPLWRCCCWFYYYWRWPTCCSEKDSGVLGCWHAPPVLSPCLAGVAVNSEK